jgi:hypothetical protein
MKSHAQLVESVQRFQESFWNRKEIGRPPVGVYDESIYLPINFLRRPFTRSTVCPEDVNGELVASEYEYSFAHQSVSCDDYMAFAAPWRGLPWLEAACGCPVRYSEGSLAPGHFVESLADLAQVPIPSSDAWLNCMRRETERLEAQAIPDCWISPSILRGPSDALAAMRGMTEFFLDLIDNPQAVESAARRVKQVLMAAIDIHYSIVQPKLGGYGHIFGYWAPGKTIMLQEDALGMCSPSVYRDIFMQFNAEIVRHLGANVLFHLHSSGYQHYSHVMEIPGIAGLEINLETIGPTLPDLVPMLREILEKTRLVLHVGTGFEYLPAALRQLPHEGLYLVIPSKFIPTDQAFREFVGGNFQP